MGSNYTGRGLENLEIRLINNRVRGADLERQIREYVMRMTRRPPMPQPGAVMVRIRPTFELCVYRGRMSQAETGSETPAPLIYHDFGSFIVRDSVMPYMFKIEDGKYMTIYHGEINE